MAQIKIPQPSKDAFHGGTLDTKYVGQIVDVINTPMEIKGGGKVIYSKEKIVLDLTGTVTASDYQYVYIVVNGELRAAMIPIKFIADFQP